METLPLHVDTVLAQERENRWTLLSGYLAVLGAGLVIGLAGYEKFGGTFALALAALACVAVAILLRPIAGVYLTVFFSVVGDGSTMGGYPFNFNFSSTRSFLYITNALTFSPLELCLALTIVGWFVHAAGARSWQVRGQPLRWPMLAFAGLVLFGFVYGVVVGGGDITVAMWELRPLLYLVVMFLLASTLFTRAAHYVSLSWVIIAAISIQNVFALKYYFELSAAELDALEALTEHTASLLYNFVFLLALALCMLRKCSPLARLALVMASIPTIFVFVLSQRRAAFVALVAGFIVLALILCFRRRKMFFAVAPIVLLLIAGYTVAFWNATEGVGFGAAAIKSVVAPGSLSEKDESSDFYRQIENFDLVETIKAEPLTGVGFGKQFSQPVPLPDISFFVFAEYIPHNSILWIWLKVGYLGFALLLFIITAALRAGIRAAMRLPSGDTLAVTVAALTFIVMFVVFAYVDIAWSAQTCLVLAVSIATCANILRLSEDGETVDATLDEPRTETRDASRIESGDGSDGLIDDLIDDEIGSGNGDDVRRLSHQGAP